MSQAHGFDAAAFERSLERRIPGARVASVTKFWRGVSRETRGVDLADGRRLVIRRDLPAASVTPTSLRFEYEVYRRLADSPVPTAKALWYEDDAIVHSCDCEALGFDEIMTVPLNPAACAETMLDRLGELLASFQRRSQR